MAKRGRVGLARVSRRLVGSALPWVRLVSVLALLWVGVGLEASSPVSAAALHHAAVVVHHGNGGVTYSYVAFNEDEINGVELLKRASLDAVTVSFGGLGEAACMIEREGCPPSICQKKVCQNGGADDPFWHFYQLNSTGSWNFAVLGASSAKIHDGDVTGWSWTAQEPKLPPATFASLQLLTARRSASANNAIVWRTGAAPAGSDSSQSWPVYAGAAVVLLLGSGAAGFFVIRGRSPEAMEPMSDG